MPCKQLQVLTNKTSANMKKFLSLMSLSLAMMASGTITVSAQKVVNNLGVDEVVVQSNKVFYSWNADSLTNEQMSKLVSAPGKTTVLKSEDEMTYEQLVVAYKTKGQHQVSTPESRNAIATKGLHFEFDANYSPLGSWKTKASGTDVNDGEEKVNYGFGANVALVHQFNEFYIGGGTGIRLLGLGWITEDGGSKFSKAYGLPFSIRGGVCDAVSEKVAFFLNGDIGIIAGLDKMRTSLLYECNVGIYYGTTKIGIGIMPTKPEEKCFFGKNLTDGFEISPFIQLGFRI